MTAAKILDLDAKSWRPHAIHGEERAWTETNCYVDLWVELLHGFGLEPLATFAFTLLTDWEGDGFTFFKVPLEDIYELFGLDTMEHNVWRPLPEQIAGQVALGRPVIVEVDAFCLPDTAGVSYGLEHVKTSVAVNAIDVEARTLGYFHGRGYWELKGDDFTGAFRQDLKPGEISLPPYTEIVKTAQLKRLPAWDLARISVAQLKKHLVRRPAENPVSRWAAVLARDLEWLKGQPLQTFHQYSFAAVRQLGSSAECAASYLRWLEQNGESGLKPAAEALDALSSSAKTLQFRVARAVTHKKPWDPSASLASMAENWDAAMRLILSKYG